MNSGQRMNHPYMMGVYMAANALRDAVLVVDGPDCGFFKGQFISSRHDLFSTLYRSGDPHRILSTEVSTDSIAVNRDAQIASTLERAAAIPRTGIVLVGSLPVCTVVGVDLERIVRGVGGHVAVPIVEIPSASLRGDWLHGYGRTLAAIAGHIDLHDAKTDEGVVAIVGHLMDRTEGDQLGNVAEMRRLLEGLELEVGSVWLDGGDVGDLASAGRAGTILSLPAGRDAARVLSGRTGAKLLELDVPVGIEGTRRWLLSVAGAMHRERQAEKLIDSELDWLIPRIEKIVSFCLVDRRALVVGEPFVISGLVEMLGDMGCAMAMVVVQGERRHPCNVPSDALFEPALDEVLDALLAMPQPFADLAIVSGEYARHVCGIVPVVELGFPSFGHHVLVPRPFFGFQGVANLVERIGNAMLSRS